MVNNLIGSCIFVIVKHLIEFFVICTPHKLDLVNLLTYILLLISELLTENIALCVCVCVCVCVLVSLSGVSSLETMLAHLFSQLFVISIQIILLLLFILLVFKVRQTQTPSR